MADRITQRELQSERAVDLLEIVNLTGDTAAVVDAATACALVPASIAAVAGSPATVAAIRP
jgi:hypothetical protein